MMLDCDVCKKPLRYAGIGAHPKRHKVCEKKWRAVYRRRWKAGEIVPRKKKKPKQDLWNDKRNFVCILDPLTGCEGMRLNGRALARDLYNQRIIGEEWWADGTQFQVGERVLTVVGGELNLSGYIPRGLPRRFSCSGS